MTCQCYRIDGPFIAEDPHCPVHGPDGLEKKIEEMNAEIAEKAETIKILREAVEAVMTWAQQKCPCEDEGPDPCPLCGATVENGVCMAIEGTLPYGVLTKLISARARK